MGSATQKAKPRREAASEPGGKRVSNSCLKFFGARRITRLRARLRRHETARQARNDAKIFATDSDDAGFAPNKKPPRAEAWRLIVKYWVRLPELKGSAADDLTVDYDVNAIGAHSERARTQIVNVLATVDSEV